MDRPIADWPTHIPANRAERIAKSVEYRWAAIDSVSFDMPIHSSPVAVYRPRIAHFQWH